MSLTLDHLSTIRADAERICSGYETDRRARIPPSSHLARVVLLAVPSFRRRCDR